MTDRVTRHAGFLACLAALALSACEKTTAPVDEIIETVETPVLQSGYWQAYITIPGGKIETGIELSHDDGNYQGSLVNGRERVSIGQVSFVDDVLTLSFPAFNTEIVARQVDGGLEGELTLVKRFGETQVMPFVATPGSETRPESTTPPQVDLSGRWSATFHSDAGDDDSYIGEFAQRGARLYGTFLHPNGDYRYLAGHVRGREFHLSTFDGSHAFIFSGTVDENGEISDAGFWSGTSWHQRWSAVRNESAKLPDAFQRAFLNPGFDRFEFSFPDETGEIVSIDDARFKDKVVIVAIAGTWCPNCNDEARFLAPFHKKYRDRGLEIVTLLFEHFDDAELAAQQAVRFREKFDIEYDTLIAGISDKTDAAATLPALSAVLAFPTTVFIDRGGNVREIHAGFTGPGTGDHYVQLQRSFTDLTETLLAESAPSSPAGLREEQP